MEFEDSVKSLTGVGEKTASYYKKLDVYTIYDLITYFPKSYIDCRFARKVSSFVFGQSHLIELKIYKKMGTNKVKGKSYSKILAEDIEHFPVEIIYFNNVYIYTKLKEGFLYKFYGRLYKNFGSAKLINPLILKDLGLIPIYPLTKGLTQNILKKNLTQALSLVDSSFNILPDWIEKKYSLIDFKTAIYYIHFPKNFTQYITARKRLVFEELLYWQIGLQKMKNGRVKKNLNKLGNVSLNCFLKNLPFNLTKAQKMVIGECVKDCKSEKLMNRLIQGDVGSGKTVVAFALCYLFLISKMQVALMAPTDILARQHYKNAKKFLDKFNIKICLLVGSMKQKEKNIVLENIANNEEQLIIGTHALFQDKVKFKKLGLIITDEQHRFGVKQREKLISKGHFPHVLVMSATPIPRTLALILYGDLDISTIDELPPGRTPVKTVWISSKKRRRALDFVIDEIKKKHQAYIVCPKIEHGNSNVENVTDYADMLNKNGFSNYNVKVLHGALNAQEKSKIMEEFVSGEIDVLVATTVIEVGVDVKAANVIIIENAEMFGLAQLHQLRGRVARGNLKAYCILISDNNNIDNKKRMEAICKSSSGFEIAKKDLILRGPGDFFGNRQHGVLKFKIANIKKDLKLAAICKKEAEEIIKEDENLDMEKNIAIKTNINRFFSNNFTIL